MPEVGIGVSFHFEKNFNSASSWKPCAGRGTELSGRAAHQFGDGNEPKASAATGFEDVRQSLQAARRIGDAVMKNDNRSGNQVLFHEPADVPHRRVHGVMRIGATKDTGITAGLSQSDLLRPSDSAGRTEQRRLRREAERGFRLFEIADEFRIGVAQRRNVTRVMIADLVSACPDRGYHARML